MRLVCPKCELEMRPAQVGVGVESMTKQGSHELHMADLYECPICQMRILAGFSQGPLTANYEPGYKGEVARYDRGGRLFHSWLNPKEKQEFRDKERRAS